MNLRPRVVETRLARVHARDDIDAGLVLPSTGLCGRTIIASGVAVDGPRTAFALTPATRLRETWKSVEWCDQVCKNCITTAEKHPAARFQRCFRVSPITFSCQS